MEGAAHPPPAPPFPIPIPFDVWMRMVPTLRARGDEWSCDHRPVWEVVEKLTVSA